jgi:predicted ATPase
MMLEALVTRALEGEKWAVIRADQISKPGMISGQVIEHLVKSGLVIADLSFHNPNVFYELALRHVVGRPTVHIIRKGDAIPFDLKDFRTITVDTQDKYELVAKLETYRAEIANYVREAVSDVSDTTNPVRIFAKELVVTVGA